MANPQVENGHIDIANEIGETLAKTHLSSYESRVLWCILRKTYGWHKKTDRISYTQFEVATGLKRWHIANTIKRLIDRRIIYSAGTGQNLLYGLQKDFEQWELLPISVIPTVTDLSNKPLPISVTDTPLKPLPISEKPLPISEKPLPISVTKPLLKSVNTKETKEKTKEITKESEEKKPYGQFLNVFLTDQEYVKLELKFNSSSNDKIEELSEALKSKAGYDKKYTDHYATILSWARRKEKESPQLAKPAINKNVWRVR